MQSWAWSTSNRAGQRRPARPPARRSTANTRSSSVVARGAAPAGPCAAPSTGRKKPGGRVAEGDDGARRRRPACSASASASVCTTPPRGLVEWVTSATRRCVTAATCRPARVARRRWRPRPATARAAVSVTMQPASPSARALAREALRVAARCRARRRRPAGPPPAMISAHTGASSAGRVGVRAVPEHDVEERPPPRPGRAPCSRSSSIRASGSIIGCGRPLVYSSSPRSRQTWLPSGAGSP